MSIMVSLVNGSDLLGPLLGLLDLFEHRKVFLFEEGNTVVDKNFVSLSFAFLQGHFS